MSAPETSPAVVPIGVFAALDGWLLTHPNVQGRFADRDEAMAAARRLAHLESWRGRTVDLHVQEPFSAELASLDPRN